MFLYTLSSTKTYLTCNLAQSDHNQNNVQIKVILKLNFFFVRFARFRYNFSAVFFFICIFHLYFNIWIRRGKNLKNTCRVALCLHFVFIHLCSRLCVVSLSGRFFYCVNLKSKILPIFNVSLLACRSWIVVVVAIVFVRFVLFHYFRSAISFMCVVSVERRCATFFSLKNTQFMLNELMR